MRLRKSYAHVERRRACRAIAHARARLEMLEQGAHRNPGAREHAGSSDAAGNAFNGGTSCPIHRFDPIPFRGLCPVPHASGRGHPRGACRRRPRDGRGSPRRQPLPADRGHDPAALVVGAHGRPRRQVRRNHQADRSVPVLRATAEPAVLRLPDLLTEGLCICKILLGVQLGEPAATGRWGAVVWAVDASGKAPALDFFLDLPDRDAAKVEALFRRLADSGRMTSRGPRGF